MYTCNVRHSNETSEWFDFIGECAEQNEKNMWLAFADVADFLARSIECDQIFIRCEIASLRQMMRITRSGSAVALTSTYGYGSRTD